MRSFDSTTLALLDSGRMIIRGMVLFDFPSGLYGFWNDVGTLTYAGVDYIGAGQLIGIDQMSFSDISSPASLTLSVAAIADTDLSPDVLATIESEQYHQRPVTISRAYFDPDTLALVSVQRRYRGYVDFFDHDETVGGEANLTCTVESRARDNTRRGWRTRADADQKRISATDGGMRHAATSGTQDIYWGKLPGTVKK